MKTVAFTLGLFVTTVVLLSNWKTDLRVNAPPTSHIPKPTTSDGTTDAVSPQKAVSEYPQAALDLGQLQSEYHGQDPETLRDTLAKSQRLVADAKLFEKANGNSLNSTERQMLLLEIRRQGVLSLLLARAQAQAIRGKYP